jgi:F-type H+-transporting ATPase subunit epsilon
MATGTTGHTFQLSVVTPERVVLEREATFAAFPASDGEVGVLAHRAPLLARLGHGALRVESAAGKESLFVSGGFAQMVENKLTLLTEEARPLAELDRAKAEKELDAAKSLPASNEGLRASREKAIGRASGKLRLASRD